ncbi:glycosyltransferase [Nocardia sp. NPDC004573]
MHIAMVHRDLHRPTRGGICAIYRSLAARMAARGHTVTLIIQQSPHPVTVDGARVVTLPRTENMTAHRASVTAVLDRIRPDVIDCSTWEAETLTYLHQLPEYRAPVLVRGEFSARTLGADDLAAVEHELVHLADRVIAVSHYASRDLADAYHIETPAVIHNGIDRDRITPGPATWPNSGLRIRLDRDGQPSDPEPIPALLASASPLPPFTADPRHRQCLVWVGKITPMKGWDRLEQIAARLYDIAVITVVLGHSRAFCPVSEHWISNRYGLML